MNMYVIQEKVEMTINMVSTKKIQDKYSIIALTGFGKINLWYINKED